MAGLFSLLQYDIPLRNVLWSFGADINLLGLQRGEYQKANFFPPVCKDSGLNRNWFFSIALSQLLHLHISPKTSGSSSQIVQPPASSVVKHREIPSPALGTMRLASASQLYPS